MVPFQCWARVNPGPLWLGWHGEQAWQETAGYICGGCDQCHGQGSQTRPSGAVSFQEAQEQRSKGLVAATRDVM